MAVAQMKNLHYIYCKVNSNGDKIFVLLEPHSSFRFQYRLLTMTTFFEIAVNIYICKIEKVPYIISNHDGKHLYISREICYIIIRLVHRSVQ